MPRPRNIIPYLSWRHNFFVPTIRYDKTLEDGRRISKQIGRDIDQHDPKQVRELIEAVIHVCTTECNFYGIPFTPPEITDEAVQDYVGRYVATLRSKGTAGRKPQQLPVDPYEYVPRPAKPAEHWQPHEATTQARHDVARVLARYGVKR